MDHTEAVRLQAVEKYLLNEFTPPQREEYEEHCFDCFECAEDLKATASFMEGVRQMIREGALEPQMARQEAPARTPSLANRGWFAWLRPAFAVPVFAALLLLIGYQNTVTIPRLNSLSQSAQVVSAPFHLAGSVRGGSEEGAAAPKLQVHSGESFILEFDFTPMRTFGAYRWQLQEPEGRIVRQGTLSGDKTNQTVDLLVNGGVESTGKYNLVFFGADASGQSEAGSEVQRLPFTVAF